MLSYFGYILTEYDSILRFFWIILKLNTIHQHGMGAQNTQKLKIHVLCCKEACKKSGSYMVVLIAPFDFSFTIEKLKVGISLYEKLQHLSNMTSK